MSLRGLVKRRVSVERKVASASDSRDDGQTEMPELKNGSDAGRGH